MKKQVLFLVLAPSNWNTCSLFREAKGDSKSSYLPCDLPTIKENSFLQRPSALSLITGHWICEGLLLLTLFVCFFLFFFFFKWHSSEVLKHLVEETKLLKLRYNRICSSQNRKIGQQLQQCLQAFIFQGMTPLFSQAALQYAATKYFGSVYHINNWGGWKEGKKIKEKHVHICPKN